MGLAGRSTSKIELGTAVLQTYAAHPVLQANRAVAAADVMGRDGLTLGVGPSHQPSIEGMLGLSYARPGQHTEEYVQRSEEHTSELQSLMRISYAVFCLKKKNKKH